MGTGGSAQRSAYLRRVGSFPDSPIIASLWVLPVFLLAAGRKCGKSVHLAMNCHCAPSTMTIRHIHGGKRMAIRLLAVPLALALAVPCLAQTTPSDSQTLQAILAEIRAIHQELKVTQTTQILLTELEIQQTVVSRATQRADDAQARLSEIKAAEKDNAGEQTRTKDALDRHADPQEAEAIADKVEELNRQAATMATTEQERTTTLQTAQQQLKDAQDALDDIQNQLNAVVKQLAPARN